MIMKFHQRLLKVDRVRFFLTSVILSQVVIFLYIQLKLKPTGFHTPAANLSKTAQFDPKYLHLQPDGTATSYYSDRYFYQRGAYTVLTNYVQGTESVPYFQTITLATHGTVDFLDNLLLLVQFWSGPISLTVYAPGPEFELTLAKIAFFRQCPPTHVASAIRARVSFHIFFETVLFPEVGEAVDSATGLFGLRLPEINCSHFSATNQRFPAVNFRSRNNLFFPINVARNVARELSKSHFVLVSDIELFPNPPDLIPRFLDLIQRRIQEGKWTRESREVFVLPPFELSANLKIGKMPRTKIGLQELLAVKPPLALPFHLYACHLCHQIPHLTNWTEQKLTGEEDNNGALEIFYSSPYVSTSAWEPFYIGSRLDPPFDERLYRENALNKVIQAAILCHSNYTFHILDKAFLVHKPGLKYGKTFKDYALKRQGIQLARHKILPLQFRLYGRTVGRCWQIESGKAM